MTNLQLHAQQESWAFEKIEPAYNAALDFRFDKSIQLMQDLGIDPSSSGYLYVENLIDFLKVFSTENELLYDSLQATRRERLNELEAVDAESPYRLFALAECKLHWAITDARFGHYFKAWREAVQAYQILEDNELLYPDFKLNQKSLAVFHSLVGIIPSKYRWGFKLLSGMEGTVEQGLREIEEVVLWTRQHKQMFYRESIIMQVYMLMHLSDQSELAKEILSASGLDPLNGPLDCFVFSNIALKTRNAKEALGHLNAYHSHKQGFDLPFFYFMRGLAALQILDKTKAKKNLIAYLNQTRSRHHIKEAHQKLAWIELLNDNTEGYKNQMNLVLIKGANREGGDQHAQAEAERENIPDKRLLMIRLLFDGGQCERAWEIMHSYSLDDFESAGQLEYLYRLGRVSHCLGQLFIAPAYYGQVIQLGAANDNYFACHAALQAGRVFEELKQYDEAVKYYQQCLNLHPEEYARYLHTQAKAGLERLSERN